MVIDIHPLLSLAFTYIYQDYDAFDRLSIVLTWISRTCVPFLQILLINPSHLSLHLRLYAPSISGGLNSYQLMTLKSMIRREFSD
jgi:hypothetical protein